MKQQSVFQRRTSFLAMGALCAVWPRLAWAAPADGFPWVNWAVSLVNLGIFLGILIYFAGPRIQGFFKTRRDTLVADLQAAERLREEAQARLDEYEARMSSLDDERKAILDEYHRQGEREKERLVEDARRQVEKMRADAELVIQQEVRKAVATIEAQAVEAAVGFARETLEKNLDERRQNALVTRYVDDMKSMPAEGS